MSNLFRQILKLIKNLKFATQIIKINFGSINWQLNLTSSIFILGSLNNENAFNFNELGWAVIKLGRLKYHVDYLIAYLSK